ncbi:MAG: aminotransferase class IV [Nitrospinaceae bacterium]
MERIVFLNGLFMESRHARISIHDRGFCYGDGLFETMRSYRGKIFHLDAHLDRLYRSMDLVYLKLPMTRGELVSAFYETLARNAFVVADALIRLTLTRGEQEFGLPIDPEIPPTVAIAAKLIQPLPEAWYREGVKIFLFPQSAHRISGVAGQVKSLNFLSNIIIRELAAKNQSMEGILVDHNNRVTEGAASNIFLVKNGILQTPRLNEFILPGITRQAVLDLAKGHGIPCSEKDIAPEEVFGAAEVFLTNSRIEILPVRQANEHRIGTGRAGEMTRFLHREFRKVVEG